jgi:hypothetical protein
MYQKKFGVGLIDDDDALIELTRFLPKKNMSG